MAFALAFALASAARAEAPLAAPRGEAPAPPAVARDYAAPNLDVARRLAIAALQDLGLALESANATTGTVAASRLDAHPLRLTVTVLAKDEARVVASVLTDYAGTAITDPRPAEAFFAAFEAALHPPREID